MMKDKNDEFFKELVEHHVSGQLKVAPEHASNKVLDLMGKPHIEVYEDFEKKFYKYTKECGKEQYLVPYLMSSHPGCTIKEAVELAVFLKSITSDPSRCRTSIPHPEQYRQRCIIQGLTLILCRRSISPVTQRKRRCKEHSCSITKKRISR